jgi:S1-C subfamily serine protease
MSHVNKTNHLFIACLVIIMTFLMTFSIYAQVRKTITKSIDDEGGMCLIKEFGGVLVVDDDEIKVDMVMPADQRHNDYKTLDIKEGDIVKMINGKKINTPEMLEKIYNSFEIGKEIKLGIFRGKEMRIVKFAKADPEKLPGQMMVIGGPDSAVEIAMSMVTVGLVASEKDGRVVIDEVIGNMLAKFDGQTPKKGDAIVKVQGQLVTSASELDKIFESVPVGEKVSLELSRQDEKYTTGFEKSDTESCSGTRKIRINKQGD